MQGFFVALHFLFFTVSCYFFMRVVLYPLLKLFVDDSELYNNPKYKKSMNILFHARLYPWPTWDDSRRRNWVRAWWKFALIGLVSFGLSIFAIYLIEIMKTKGQI